MKTVGSGAIGSVLVVAGSLVAAGVLLPPEAHAIPSFAAQTGQPCSACHIGFPELTPYGREFKLEGYVAGGMFPGLKNFSVMQDSGITHLRDGVPGGLGAGFKSNNVVNASQTSLFYGGAIDANIGLGAFVQTTYQENPGKYHWDNTDVRLAQRFNLFGKPLFWGVTFNNNPSVSDLWNGTPAWGYPYIHSFLAPKPAAAPQIASLGAVVYGIGTFGAMNVTASDLFYAEADIYKTLPSHLSYALGTGPAPRSAGVIPYLRVAYQHQWGKSSIEVGNFDLFDQLYPAGEKSGQTDRFLDIGVDSQLQYITKAQAFSFLADFVHESQDYRASYPMGLVANPSDTLDTLRLTAADLVYQKVQLTESFQTIYGTPDNKLYAPGGLEGSLTGKPNSNSWTTELDYYPYNNGGPSWLPWLNMKVFMIDTFYPVFNGASKNYNGKGRNAGANNSIYAGIWLLF